MNKRAAAKQLEFEYLAFLQGWLDKLGMPEFKPREFCNPRNYRKRVPPKRLWMNIVPALKALRWLRRKWGKAINIIAAFRLTGGAKRSQHKYNRAIDADCSRKEDLVAWTKLVVRLYKTFKCISVGQYENNPQRAHLDGRPGRQAAWLKGRRKGVFRKPPYCRGRPIPERLAA